MQHMRLMALLGELVRDKGAMKATKELGVDYRTLTVCLETGRLSRRMRGALEKALLEGGGSPAAEQRERNEELEGQLKDVADRVESLGKDVSKGLAAVQGDRERRSGATTTRGCGVWRSWSRAGAGRTLGKRRAQRGRPRGKPSLRREFPDLVTLEPASDDEGVFGDAWPLVAEWRGLKATHPNEGRGLEWLSVEERVPGLGAGAAGGARDDAAPGDVPAEGLRTERAGQLAQDSALRHAEGAEGRLSFWGRLTFGLWRR